ncbi:hypothetical protein HanRHA438_Chr10g0477441 [Helianthus annuus]|nr:hypothetical protein HanIR_Chr10g0501271 [Helianthus annuus]KAJ0881737.1 hypothetical protein HanRHA438_Chr10g0477441 [Helianthus annuus]
MVLVDSKLIFCVDFRLCQELSPLFKLFKSSHLVLVFLLFTYCTVGGILSMLFGQYKFNHFSASY